MGTICFKKMSAFVFRQKITWTSGLEHLYTNRRICALWNENMLTLFVEIKYEKIELLNFQKNGVPLCKFETIFGKPKKKVSSLRYEQMLSLSYGELIKHYTGVDNPLSPLLISLVAPCRILQTISKLIPSSAAPQSIAWKTHYQSSSTDICPWTHFPNL